MTLDLHILADTDNGAVGKIIFVILGLVIWGVGALASMVKKQKRQEEERQRAMMEQVRLEMQAGRAAGAGGPARVREAVPVPPPAPGYRPNVLPDWVPQQGITVPPPPPPVYTPAVYTPPRQYTPVPPYAAPAPPQSQPQPQKRRKQPKRDRRPQAPVPVAPVEETPPVRPLAAGEAPPKSARAAGSSANAAALSRWMTPRTLRSQFILTEILQPPLAMREPRDV